MNNLTNNQKAIYDECIRVLDFSIKLSEGYYYDSLVLCLIDAIFSIGVRYQCVKKVVNNYCCYFKIDRKRTDCNNPSDKYTINNYLNDIKDFKNGDFGADTIYHCKQRTSTRNGILKAEAVYNIANILKKHNILTIKDMQLIINNRSNVECDLLKNDFISVKGQKSGISFEYFLMLAGDDNTIKVDRWLLKFCQNATKTNSYDKNSAYTDLLMVTDALKKKHSNLTPRLLDHMIWNYARNNYR